MTTDKPTRGYNKHPIWQWTILYIIVAAIVYGVLYYLFFRQGTTPNYTY